MVGSYSTPIDAADPFRQMTPAACNGAERLLVRRRRLPGRDSASGVGAFHLHWDGSDAADRLRRRRGAASATSSSTRGELFESDRSSARAPENRSRPGRPRRAGAGAARCSTGSPAAASPTTRSCRRRCRACPPTAPSCWRSTATAPSLWAVGGGAASGPSAPRRRRRSRGRRWRRGSVGGAFAGAGAERRRPSAPTDRFGDVAAVPGSDDALAPRSPFAERAQRQRKATRRADRRADGSDDDRRRCRPPAPGAAAPRGSPARRRTTAGWSPAPAGSSTTPTARALRARHRPGLRRARSTFRPNEAAEQFVPDAPPADDSQLFAPPPVELEPRAAGSRRSRSGACRRCCARCARELHGLHADRHASRVTRRARVQLLAKRRRQDGRRARRRADAARPAASALEPAARAASS